MRFEVSISLGQQNDQVGAVAVGDESLRPVDHVLRRSPRRAPLGTDRRHAPPASGRLTCQAGRNSVSGDRAGTSHWRFCCSDPNAKIGGMAIPVSARSEPKPARVGVHKLLGEHQRGVVVRPARPVPQQACRAQGTRARPIRRKTEWNVVSSPFVGVRLQLVDGKPARSTPRGGSCSSV